MAARFDRQAIPVEESGLAPKEIWCNESQERYAIALDPAALPVFRAICARERCPFSIIGEATEARELILSADAKGTVARDIDMPMEVLLGKPPKMQRTVDRVAPTGRPLDLSKVSLASAAFDVLRHPSVASKRFLISIGDRTVGGLSSRDPMVGPWQVPVADCAVTLADYAGFRGEAMAIGERAPIALLNAPAAARMAVGEAITNLLAAPIELDRVKLSCNWMAACGEPGEDAALYDSVRAVGLELAPALGIGIPVGKDSLSMRTRWSEDGQTKQVTSPVSLVVSAFATLADVRVSSTPQLVAGDTTLLLVDLGAGRMRLGGSMLAQVSAQLGDEPPDLDQPGLLKSLVAAISDLRARGLVLAYHDRSDGGLWATVCEMAFAGHRGVSLNVDMLVTEGDGIGDSRAEHGDSKNWASQVSARRDELTLRALFNEELGVVIQVASSARDQALQALRAHGLGRHSHVIGKTNDKGLVEVWRDAKAQFSAPLRALHQAWDEVSWRIARLRDNPACADAEHDAAGREDDPGLHVHVVAAPAGAAPALLGSRPRLAVLREQGVNSHVELSYAMDKAGFDTYDVHMTDLQSGRVRLDGFQGFVACGGFSYGDTLGAGEGWARSILFNARLVGPVRFVLRPHRRLRARRLQWLPDAGGARRHDSRHRRVAAFHAQQERAIRGPPQPRRGAAVGLDLLQRHGRKPPADRGRAWRGLRRLQATRRCAEGSRCAALRRSPWPADRGLSGQPQRQPGRPDRRDHQRWPVYRADAAPGARLSQRADELDLGRAQRRQPLDAHLRERPAGHPIAARTVAHDRWLRTSTRRHRKDSTGEQG